MPMNNPSLTSTVSEFSKGRTERSNKLRLPATIRNLITRIRLWLRQPFFFVFLPVLMIFFLFFFSRLTLPSHCGGGREKNARRGPPPSLVGPPPPPPPPVFPSP